MMLLRQGPRNAGALTWLARSLNTSAPAAGMNAGRPGSVLPERTELTEEEKNIASDNYAKSKESQVKHMQEIETDRTGWRDPDPYSGTNTAGTVSGTIGEFVAEDESTSRSTVGNMRNPDDLRAKEQAAAAQGYEPERTPISERTKIEPSTPDRITQEGVTPFPETVGQKVKNFMKESVETLTHGVNNAGQPQVEEKLKSQ